MYSCANSVLKLFIYNVNAMHFTYMYLKQGYSQLYILVYIVEFLKSLEDSEQEPAVTRVFTSFTVWRDRQVVRKGEHNTTRIYTAHITGYLEASFGFLPNVIQTSIQSQLCHKLFINIFIQKRWKRKHWTFLSLQVLLSTTSSFHEIHIV